MNFILYHLFLIKNISDDTSTQEMPQPLKAPSIATEDDTLRFFSEKIRLGISCESAAMQTTHMKCQALHSLNDNNNNNNNN